MIIWGTEVKLTINQLPRMAAVAALWESTILMILQVTGSNPAWCRFLSLSIFSVVGFWGAAVINFP